MENLRNVFIRALAARAAAPQTPSSSEGESSKTPDSLEEIPPLTLYFSSVMNKSSELHQPEINFFGNGHLLEEEEEEEEEEEGDFSNVLSLTVLFSLFSLFSWFSLFSSCRDSGSRLQGLFHVPAAGETMFDNPGYL